MELRDFRNGSFVQTVFGLAKVLIPESGMIKVTVKNGAVYELDDVTRVYLSGSQLKQVSGYEKIGTNSFVINGLPGVLSFNETIMSFEWLVGGVVIRHLDYLDELQDLFKSCTGNDLF